MKKLILVIVLFLCIKSETFHRLEVNQQTKLKTGDRLISTLGYFTATLQSKECSLLL